MSTSKPLSHGEKLFNVSKYDKIQKFQDENAKIIFDRKPFSRENFDKGRKTK